ncbi:MAG TPA: hypothetical protein PKX64_06325, partial [Elusimicrobiota bacterium]|nr:hypothetical protein [Elusimicrobiota bacterium]
RVGALSGAEVLATDCEEYPCIAIIRSNSDAPDWVKELDPLSKDLEAAGFGDSISVMGAASETRDDDGRGTRLYAWGVAPGCISKFGPAPSNPWGPPVFRDNC